MIQSNQQNMVYMTFGMEHAPKASKGHMTPLWKRLQGRRPTPKRGAGPGVVTSLAADWDPGL